MKNDPRQRRGRRAPPKRAAAAATAGTDRSGLVVAAVLLLTALALYGGSLRNPLVFDDALLADPATLKAYAAFPPDLRLRWLSNLSFGWTHAVTGADWYWHRLVNVALHAATAAALFGFLARLFAATLEETGARWLAFYGAMLFLLHPAAVYGAAYLIERSIVMATLFSLISLRCVLEGLLRGSMAWFLGAAAAYLHAVSSKEHAVMLPAVAAALVMLAGGKAGASLRRLAVPALIFGLIGLAVAFQARTLIGATYEPFSGGAIAALAERRSDFDPRLAYPLSVLNQGWLFFRYLLAWILPWPGWMSVDVRTPLPVQLVAWPQTIGFLAWLAYPVAAVALLRRGGRLGLAGLGLLSPWLLALTEMGVVRFQEPFVLYRSYLWMALLFAILPAVLWRVSPRWRHAIVAVACVGLVAAALDRLGTFSSDLRLWDDVVRKNGDSQAHLVERGYVNRGMARFDLGQREAALGDFERAIALNGRYPDAWLGRASVHLSAGRPEQALADLDRALALDDRYASAWDKRCVAQSELGRLEAARADCERAVAIEPRNADALVNTGALYQRLGLAEAAADSYRRALAVDPAHGPANHNLGVLLLDAGRRDEIVRGHIVKGCKAGIAGACDILKRSRSGS